MTEEGNKVIESIKGIFTEETWNVSLTAIFGDLRD